MSRNVAWGTFVCLASLLLLGSTARADYGAGQAAWKAGQYSEALTQWEAAAGTGDSRAMLALGRAYVKGLGVPQDYVLAHKWLNLAAGRGSAEAAAERKALAAKMAPRQIASAQEMARAWRPGGKAEAPKATAVQKSKASSPPTNPPPKRAIHEAQELMGKLGYKPGPVDGVWGPRSERAYAAFLRDAGLPAGKVLSLAALHAMRRMAGEEKAPKAVAKAGVAASKSKAPPTEAGRGTKVAGATRAASGPAPKCTAWNTSDFFEAATSDLVTRCLRRGADPKAKDRNGKTPLHLAAAWSGDPAVIDALARAGADLAAREKDYEDTPLHEAAKSDNNPAAVIGALVRAGADLSAVSAWGEMPLDLAANLGNTPATTALVKAVSDAGLTKTFGVTPLHEAALAEEADAVSSLLNAGADPNARYRNGATPLHWAAPATGNPAVIAALVKGGADPNARNKRGETPLHWAANFSRTPAILDALLQAGADLNARNKRGETPLHRSVWNEGISVMTTLLEAGADPNAGMDGPGKGDRPLHNAAWRENPIFVKTLLEAGADPNVRGSFVETPLHDAAHNRNPAIAALLLDAGADPNARSRLGKTPLDEALSRNNRAVADLLLKGGGTATAKAKVSIDPNARDKDGRTSLHRAAASGTPSWIETLLKAGADPNARDEHGKTPLHTAARNKNLAIVAALVAGGARLNAQDGNGETPLHRAASWNSNPEVVGALLKAGADPNARNKRQKTPLHGAASRKEDARAVGLLLRAGADPNARDRGSHTPLHTAAYNKNPGVGAKVIAHLLGAGANPNIQNEFGNTPLHNAAGSNVANLAATVALLKGGADPNVPDEYDDTPLHYAAGNSDDPGILEALLEAGADPNARFKNSDTPLHSAVSAKNPAAIATLLKAGADPSIPDFFGRIPMDYARKKNDRAVIAALQQGQRRHTASARPAVSRGPTGECASGPICRQTVKNAEVVLKRVDELQATKNLDITNSSLAVAFTTRATIACMKACLEREETRAKCRSPFEQAIGELQQTYESAVRSARQASLDDAYVDEFEASPQNSRFGRRHFSHIQGNLDTCGYGSVPAASRWSSEERSRKSYRDPGSQDRGAPESEDYDSGPDPCPQCAGLPRDACSCGVQ